MPAVPLLRRLLLLALVVAAPACRRPDSILLIEISGSVLLQPVQFRVTVTTGIESRAIMVPPAAGGPVMLPTSFSVELDRSRTGPVTVSVDALDPSMSSIACGTTTQEHIQIGGQTVITVVLQSCDGGGGAGGAGGTNLDGASD